MLKPCMAQEWINLFVSKIWDICSFQFNMVAFAGLD